MNVSCPDCRTTYRIDSRKVPSGGIRARCIRCPGEFDVGTATGDSTDAASAPSGSSIGDVQVAAPEETADAGSVTESAEEAVGTPTGDHSPSGGASVPDESVEEMLPPAPFGSSDPKSRARRLARVLVSDIVVYHPERRERSLREGTIRQEFREEIKKSWDEYVSQVGNEIARETSYFQEALNEILAGGTRIF